MEQKPGKPTMRAVCAVLDAFHFTLPWDLEADGGPVASEAGAEEGAAEGGQGGAGDGGQEEEEGEQGGEEEEEEEQEVGEEGDAVGGGKGGRRRKKGRVACSLVELSQAGALGHSGRKSLALRRLHAAQLTAAGARRATCRMQADLPLPLPRRRRRWRRPRCSACCCTASCPPCTSRWWTRVATTDTVRSAAAQDALPPVPMCLPCAPCPASACCCPTPLPESSPVTRRPWPRARALASCPWRPPLLTRCPWRPPPCTAGVRAPVAIAVVKLFKLLPPAAERLHLPSTFTKVGTPPPPPLPSPSPLPSCPTPPPQTSPTPDSLPVRTAAPAGGGPAAQQIPRHPGRCPCRPGGHDAGAGPRLPALRVQVSSHPAN